MKMYLDGKIRVTETETGQDHNTILYRILTSNNEILLYYNFLRRIIENTDELIFLAKRWLK